MISCKNLFVSFWTGANIFQIKPLLLSIDTKNTEAKCETLPTILNSHFARKTSRPFDLYYPGDELTLVCDAGFVQRPEGEVGEICNNDLKWEPVSEVGVRGQCIAGLFRKVVEIN